MGASGGAFAYKFILAYSMYIIIWTVIWGLGFNAFYVQSFPTNKILNTASFNPSLQTNFTSYTWVCGNLVNCKGIAQLTDSQLQNLPDGTTIDTVSTLEPQYYATIINKSSPTWLCPTEYNVINADKTYNNGEDIICYTQIAWVNIESSSSISSWNVTVNTTAEQQLQAGVTIDPTSLWGQIVLMFGFISGMQLFSSSIWYLALFNFGLFMTFLYCFIGEILIPFGIHIPFV